MIYRCTLVNRIEIPLKAFSQENTFRLYLNDTALLFSLLELNFADILLDKSFMYKGAIAENFIAQTLFCNGISLYYWSYGNKAEIDFLLYNQDGIIPVEVKAGDNTKAKSLNIYMEKYNPKYAIKLSTKNFGFENNIKSIPIYATFCIEK